jgi:hypothetical protein
MAYSLPPLVNGKSYEHADIVVGCLGQALTTVRLLDYGESQEMKNEYGSGNSPVSRTYGNRIPTAKMTILMEELELFQSVAPLGQIQRIPEFDISINFVDSTLVPRTHVIKNCRFMNNKRVVNQGDGAIECELEIICSNIVWNS